MVIAFALALALALALLLLALLVELLAGVFRLVSMISSKPWQPVSPQSQTLPGVQRQGGGSWPMTGRTGTRAGVASIS